MTPGELIKEYWSITDTAPSKFERSLIAAKRKRMAANCLERIQKNNPLFDTFEMQKEIEGEINS